MIIEVLASFIASFAFGVVFNIRGKKLFFSALCGALSWFVYKILLRFGASDTAALFFASIVLSVYSEIFARILKTPVTTFVIVALIPLVPGGGMYYTMFEAIKGDVMKSLEIGIKTMVSAGALAIGVILVSTITKTLTRYNLNKKLKEKTFKSKNKNR